MSDALLKRLKEERSNVASTINATLNAAAEENRDLTDVEDRNLSDLDNELKRIDARIEQLTDLALRNAKAADALSKVEGRTSSENIRVKSEPSTYGPENRSASFFLDMVNARNGDFEAAERFNRHRREMEVENRDMTTSAGVLGSFVPPKYLLSDYAEKVRYNRVVANIVPRDPHPMTTSWSIPRITTGTATGFQSSENSALTEQDMVTTDVTVASRTLGGFVDVSLQAVEFSGVALDRLIFDDLARDYAEKVEDMVLNSTTTNNKGFLQQSGTNAVEYTDGTPTISELYAQIGKARNEIDSNRKAGAEVIIMGTYLYNWLASRSDSSGRPLMTAVAPQNAPGLFNGATQGFGGVIMGLPVYVSHAIGTDFYDGAATPGSDSQESPIIVARISDTRLWETSVPTFTFTDVGSANLTVRYRLHGHVGFTCGRFPAGITVIQGSGLDVDNLSW